MPERRQGDGHIAFGSLLFGAGLGGAVLALNVFLVRTGQANPEVAGPTTTPAFLGIGAVTAFIVAAVAAFVRARAFGMRWQRIALGVMAPTGAMFLASLAMPLDNVAGRTGIAVLVAMLVGLAFVGSRLVVRGETTSA